MRPLHERDIERHLVKRVKAIGGEVRKVQWIGRRGAPDRLVMLPRRQKPGSDYWHEPHQVWVELKAPDVEPPAYQLREHDRMRAMGCWVEVIDSLARVEALLS